MKDNSSTIVEKGTDATIAAIPCYVPCLPCPFCGNAPFINKHDASWSVVCPICVTVTRIGVTKEIAIERWNKRHGT